MGHWRIDSARFVAIGDVTTGMNVQVETVVESGYHWGCFIDCKTVEIFTSLASSI